MYAITLSLRQVFHVRTFRQVLPDQSIGVFVGAPLPGGIRVSEVEGCVSGRFDLRVLMKLGTIICRDGLEFGSLGLQRLDASLVPSSVKVRRTVSSRWSNGNQDT